MRLSNPLNKNSLCELSTDYIPERFRREILMHIFKNAYAEKHHDYKTPLILAISGPPGMGKSYQTETILSSISEKVLLKKMSGSDFEHEYAGVPIQNLKKLYLDVSQSVLFREADFGVIMIDDIDSALGKWDDLVQYTMNRQLLIKALIDLADNPYEVEYLENEKREKSPTKRIPFIVTLNDEQKMYKPLMRNGRTHIFPWIPDRDELNIIISKIFKDINLNFEIMDLYDELTRENIKDIPISLFSDIKSSLNNDCIWEIINETGINQSAFNEFEQCLKIRKKYSFNELLKLAFDIISQNKNYL